MSSRGGKKSSKGKSISEGYNEDVNQLSRGVAGTKLVSAQDDGGEWEVIARKSKNKSGNNGGKSWVPQNSNPKAWGHSGRGSNVNVSGRGNANAWGTQATDPRVSAGRGNSRNQTMNRGYDNNYGAPQAAIRPPLEKGWNWQSGPGSTLFRDTEDEQDKTEAEDPENLGGAGEEDDSGSDALDDSDEDLLSDDYDSDVSQKSHGTRKNNKWFKKFFESLDSLSIQQINEPQRQWHCPACQNGPGSIDWYCLQPLITHARTKGARRVKLHRELAELLDEDLRRRGASVFQAGDLYGQWKGLGEEEKDREIVWPPVVMIMNTRLDRDDNDKWVGMGNPELLEYFINYPAIKARHSYGPQGHRGMSALIFESSATGYLEAERLAKDLAEQGLDRNAWERRRNLFHAGKRQLYGFLATKADIDIFNQHSQGNKSGLKVDMRSYQEMVVKELRQISEENQQLNWFKNKLSKKNKHAKALEESLEIMSERLRKTNEEYRIVRQRTKMQHEQNRVEMDSQDMFFKDQIQMIHEARDAKEEIFEKLQQQERAKVKEQSGNASSNDEYRKRAEEISNFIEFQEKEMEEFVEEREKVIKEHEEKMVELRRRHYQEVLELERDFDDALNQLMDKYAPHDPQ